VNGDSGYIAMHISGLEVFQGAGFTDSGSYKQSQGLLPYAQEDAPLTRFSTVAGIDLSADNRPPGRDFFMGKGSTGNYKHCPVRIADICDTNGEDLKAGLFYTTGQQRHHYEDETDNRQPARQHDDGRFCPGHGIRYYRRT
jgi:hypothetical protein